MANSIRAVAKWAWGYRLALLLLWLLAVCLVQPTGNFSINDDWSYGTAVKHLLKTGHFQLVWNTTPALVTQVLWGAVFCKLFGFSFVTLRASTLVMSILGVLAFYDTLLLIGARRNVAFAGSLLLMSSPFFFCLAFSFMTDSFFLSIMIFSLFFLLRQLETGSKRDLVLGIVLAMCATLTRQIGICIPAAWGVLHSLRAVKRSKDLAADLVKAWVPLAIVGGSLVIYSGWLKMRGEAPVYANLMVHELINALRHPNPTVHALQWEVRGIIPYTGMLLFPVLPIIWQRIHSAGKTSTAAWVASSCWIVGMAAFLALRHKPLPPMFYNVLEQVYMIGPYKTGLWYLVSIAGIIAGCMLILLLFHGIGSLRDDIDTNLPMQRFQFLFLLFCIYYLPTLLVDVFYDRYITPTIPICFMMILLWTQRNHQESEPSGARLAMVASFVLLAGYGLFSVLGTRDYFAYHRADWMARRYLLSQGVAPRELFHEFNSDGEFLDISQAAMRGPTPVYGSGYMVVPSVTYTTSQIVTTPVSESQIEQRYPVHLLLNSCSLDIYVLNLKR